MEVLDHPSDAGKELKPKRPARAGDVGEAGRHLSQDDLEAFVAGRLPAARQSYCHIHLDSCVACRAELEDLRTLKSEAAAFPRADSLGRELERRRKSRTLAMVRNATVAIVLVAVASTAVWWGRDRWLAKRRAVAATVAVPSPQPLPGLTHSRESASASSAAPEINKGFALLSPFGDAITDTRPEFHWTPLAGAVRYSVAIVDERLHPVQHSHALRTTSWRPRRPLRRGRTYLWQVTATLRGGSTVVASGPSSPGALLHISPK
jgi:hypothetical protein